MSDAPNTGQSQPTRIEAPAAKDPAVRLFIFAGLLLAFGIWLFIDGHLRKLYPYKPLAQDINAWFKWLLNCWGPLLFVPAGLVMTSLALRVLRRTLVADEEGIGYLGCQKLRWEQIQRVDASRLASKGLLDLHAAGGRKLTLDSWKLENFRNVVAFVETHVPPEAIAR